jgi:hypothetical protein
MMKPDPRLRTALASATPAQRAAVQAYRQAIAQDCRTGVWAQSELRQLEHAARATGYHGYLPAPGLARDDCEQAP